MSTIEIRKSDITDLDTDAIVNAANNELLAGGGVCKAIFRAAGYEQLQAECSKIGHCDTGSAVITAGFNLKAKYIIHAAGPVWSGGKSGEPRLLHDAYMRSLELAAENGCKSIGFPLISAGIFGYPVDRAWRNALQACTEFISRGYGIDIVFAVINDGILEAGTKALREIAPRYAPAVRGDWKTSEMPARHDTFILDRCFTPQQMKKLRKGNIPQGMEDKWFWYMEGDTLFAHRSWTGYCIYRIDFSLDNCHVVTVSREPEQYKCTSIDEDRESLKKLLDWWTDDPYDHYHEWLWETADTIKKAGTAKAKDKLMISSQEVEAIFFHSPTGPHGYLSNWYPSPFDLDGIHYCSAEQYIMYQKCLIFGDTASAQAILAADDPKIQQKIGKKAKGFIENIWAGLRQLILLRGLLGKFSQNEELKKKLIDTADAWLVECAHSDTVWACGIRINETWRFDASKWRGQNILGFALMEVRSILRSRQ